MSMQQDLIGLETLKEDHHLYPRTINASFNNLLALGDNHYLNIEINHHTMSIGRHVTN